jgi:hypothetical protein
VGHVEFGIHASFENRDAAQLFKFCRMGVEVEAAGNDHIKTGICSLTRRRYEIGSGDGAEFGTNKNTRPALGSILCIAFRIAALGADEFSRPAVNRDEDNAVFFMRLLHARGLQVLQHELPKIRFAIWRLIFGNPD